jgi:hypothetical protein
MTLGKVLFAVVCVNFGLVCRITTGMLVHKTQHKLSVSYFSYGMDFTIPKRLLICVHISLSVPFFLELASWWSALMLRAF